MDIKQNRVVQAIAEMPKVFSMKDVEIAAGVTAGAIPHAIKELRNRGMIEVVRVEERGRKIWHKTDKFSVQPEATVHPSVHRKIITAEREKATADALIALGNAMKGWRPCA